jgi:hypothetical protein
LKNSKSNLEMETNVLVAVRCRPMSTREKERGCGSIITTPSNKSVHIAAPRNDGGGHERSDRDFTFDHCYFTDTTQELVYTDIGSPVVGQALDGFNCTIFAYGQTGSGKSHSMMGSDGDEVGIIPRLVVDLWKRIDTLHATSLRKSEEEGKTDYFVTVSFLEIYNEEIKDLINPSKKVLKIRENKEKGIYVEELCELIVKDSHSVLKLIDQGNAVRRVAATNMNDQSSRSHSVFTIKIEQKTDVIMGDVHKISIVKAKLNLVDLAGSERAEKTGASGSTLKEGANINMSLMALGNVINALSEAGSKRQHIPYRDSKLTRLLQESLGGNAATVMIAAISPADYNYDETLSTLKYANRAKTIANAVTKNEDINQRMINDLKKEIEELKAAVAKGGTGGSDHGEDQKKIKEMEEMQKNSWEERERLAKQLEEERQANLSVAMSTMLEEVKDKKVEQMKNIKRLANEKSTLAKKIKDGKSKHTELKAKVDTDMKEYSQLQLKYDEALKAGNESLPENEEIAKHMADILKWIDGRRSQWVTLKAEIKSMKDRLANIEDEIIAEKAELVATAGLLDQNDKLRASIEEEEREKAKNIIETEILAAKKKYEDEHGSELIEKSELINSLQDEISKEKLHKRELQMEVQEKEKKIADLEKYSSKLEEKVADAEVLLEASREENASLLKKTDSTSSHEDFEKLQGKLAVFENTKYDMFEALMDQFNDDRKDLLKKYQESQTLLKQASNDIMYLSQQNNKMKALLQESLTWER